MMLGPAAADDKRLVQPSTGDLCHSPSNVPGGGDLYSRGVEGERARGGRRKWVIVGALGALVLTVLGLSLSYLFLVVRGSYARVPASHQMIPW
jgi:hypothetical protein